MRVRSRHLALFASLALFVGAACSENDTSSSAREVADAGTNDEDAAAPSTETDGGAGAKDAGRDAPKVDAASSDAASGDAASSGDGGDAGLGYPTAHLGTNPRVGSTPGDVIHDYAFTGYRATGGVLDTSTLRTIRLADYYDPLGKKGLKVLHLVAAARWSAPDGALVQAAVTATSTLAAKGGVFLVVVGEGTSVGANASKGDLDAWANAYAPHFSLALDPGFAQLSALWDVSAVPFNVDIDLRSMEILATDLGAPANLEATVDAHLTWVATHAPSWP